MLYDGGLSTTSFDISTQDVGFGDGREVVKEPKNTGKWISKWL